jgi:predicted transglutaminase-like cysteine proteinase
LVVADAIAPPAGAFSFCIENADQCGAQSLNHPVKHTSKEDTAGAENLETATEPRDQPAEIERSLSDTELLAMAQVINASINTMITYRSDDEVWNTQERWILPIQSAGIHYGDCDD